MRMMGFLLALVSTLGVSAADDEYRPSWACGDSWRVEVTYPVTFRREPPIYTDSPAGYPATNMYEYQSRDVVYTYSVKTVGEKYTFKPPLYDAFVARPGRPNRHMNETNVTVIGVAGPTNAPSYGSWELRFETNTMALLEIREKRSGGYAKSRATPYGKESWMMGCPYYGMIIHDFPIIPEAGTNELRTVSMLVDEGSFTQETVFAESSVTCRMWGNNPDARDQREVILTWDRGAKWWRRGTVTLNGHPFTSAVLLED